MALDVFNAFDGFVVSLKEENNDGEKCLDCGRLYTSYNWCQICNSKYFVKCFAKWSSEDQDIDRFIRNTQIDALSRSRVLEWIPFDQLIDFELIGKGGFGNVQTATWIQGQIDIMIGWNYLQQRWERHGRTKVVVKMLDYSKEIPAEFLNEMMPQVRTHPIIPNHTLNRLIRIFGISKNPSTQKYAIIMQFAENGNLRDYLNNSTIIMKWEKKLFMLQYIAESLKFAHESGLIYKNFHSGNILIHEEIPFLGDLGLCRPVNKFEKKSEIYGVLPYVAPEVLRTKEYTKESDIYSFAFIMWEMCTHQPPLYNRSHDANLALDICLGERPEILEGTPQILVKLMNKCWDAIPSKRPTAEEIFISLRSCYMDVSQKNPTVSYSDFKAADNWKKFNLVDIKHHPNAYYQSRNLEFLNLPEAINDPLANQDINDSFEDDIDSDSDYLENPHFRGYTIRGCKW